MGDLNIAVLGAGIIGMTTAIELRKDLRNASIDLIAEDLYEGTTSYVAAGIFIPEAGKFGATEEITRKWVINSYHYWDQIRTSSESDMAGIKQISGYMFASETPHLVRNKYLEKLVPIYRQVTEDELKLCPGNWKFGSYFSTILTDTSRHLKWALNKVETSDIKIHRRKINDFREIDPKYDIIVNCTGFGAKLLCDDGAVIPLRGQVAKVEAPWIENFIFGDYNTYIIPAFDSVTLGGCRQYESYNKQVDNYDYLAMRERCEKLVPSLKNAKLIENRVGLRPFRKPVRLEAEYRNIDGRNVRIVHNYGHGGYGVTTAPGTALNAVQLVRDMLLQNRSKL